MATTATPKIVGKALYLELVADPTLNEEQSRNLLGWEHKGTKQVLVFPQYQDDTGRIHEPIIMSRIVSNYRPRSQWDTTRLRGVKDTDLESTDNYANYHEYNNSEWADLTEREKAEARKRAVSISLRRIMLDTTYEGEGDERKLVAKQGWVVRDSKPISVEVTDLDLAEVQDYKTPQAVIRRINKVRDTLDKFPKKLA